MVFFLTFVFNARFMEPRTNSCLVEKFSNLSCGSLHLIQHYDMIFGCFILMFSLPALSVLADNLPTVICSCLLFAFSDDGLNNSL